MINTTSDFLKSLPAVYIDASTLMHSTNLINFLQNFDGTESKLIIPSCVHEQLLFISQEGSDRSGQAREALELCDDLYNSCFRLEHTEERKPAKFFLDLVEAKQYGAPIMIITQSTNLAHSINIRRIKGSRVLVKRINMGGFMANFDFTKPPPRFTQLSDRTNAASVLKNLI